jgi:hypothetical protein
MRVRLIICGPGIGTLNQAMRKNRYHGIYLNTGPDSDGTPLCHDLAGIAVDRARPSGRPMI